MGEVRYGDPAPSSCTDDQAEEWLFGTAVDLRGQVQILADHADFERVDDASAAVDGG